MNRTETAKLLALLQSEYPLSFSKLTKEQIDLKLELWASEFAGDPFEAVYTALRMYMETGEQFAPNIGQIRKRMQMQKQQDELSEGEALAMVAKACRNGSYGYMKEYAKLPPDVQKAVGRPEQLRDWARLDENDFQTIAGSQFLRSFRAVRQWRKEAETYPPALKNMIDKLQIGMVEHDALPGEDIT
jgi:hypothetical protein